MTPTHEFLLHMRVYKAWMPTIWGWVEEAPPGSPPLIMNFDVEGDGTGNAVWVSTPGPPTNSSADIALLAATTGNPTFIFPAPDCTPLNDGEIWTGLQCEWNPTLSRYEYFLFPR